MTTDHRVIATAADAILAKAATVRAGYYKDPFLEPLAVQAVGISTSGRDRKQFQPIIKKGTHARVCCIDRAIEGYLNLPHEKPPQVVVLGAGKDTSFYRHASKAPQGGGSSSSTKSQKADWFEVDFPLVMAQKAAILQSQVYKSKVEEKKEGQQMWRISNKWAPHWSSHLIGFDLRESPELLLQKLQECGFEGASRPVLFVVECVHMYLPKATVSRLWRFVAQTCPSNTHIVLYDTIVGRDRFGTVMEQHLRRAQVATEESCLVQTRSLDDHLALFTKEAGFCHAVGCNMWSAYQTILTNEQRMTANRAEILDEMEEWMMIMQHYCFVVARTKESSPVLCEVGGSSCLGFQKHQCREASG